MNQKHAQRKNDKVYVKGPEEDIIVKVGLGTPPALKITETVEAGSQFDVHVADAYTQVTRVATANAQTQDTRDESASDAAALKQYILTLEASVQELNTDKESMLLRQMRMAKENQEKPNELKLINTELKATIQELTADKESMLLRQMRMIKEHQMKVKDLELAGCDDGGFGEVGLCTFTLVAEHAREE